MNRKMPEGTSRLVRLGTRLMNIAQKSASRALHSIICQVTLVSFVAACAPRPTLPETPIDAGKVATKAEPWIRQSAIDPGVNACENFYRHSCDAWIASTDTTESKPAVYMAREQFTSNLESAMQRLFAENVATGDAELQRLRTFHSSCMVSAEGSSASDLATTRQWLSRIDRAQSAADIQSLLFALQRIGVGAFFDYSGRPNRADWGRYRGEIHQSRLWTDARVVENTLRHAGSSEATARRDTAAIIAITDVLRKHQVDRSDPAVAEHPSSIRRLERIAPQIDWRKYFELVGASASDTVNVTSPEYIGAVGELLENRDPRDLRAYLRWSFLFSLRGELPSPFNQAFGDVPPNIRVAVNEPNRRCHEATIRAMGVEFSRQFAEHVLGWNARQTAQSMADSIRRAVVESIGTRPWLSQEARAATADKLIKTDLKIGYPERWPEVGSFPLRPDGFLDNVLAARMFEQQRAWTRAKRARSRAAWEMYVYPWEGEGMAAARLVVPNGFPDAFSNSIIMTAAYLTPPTFDPAAPIEVNYASFGSVFAHELVHVAELHMFGADGRDAELWSKADENAEKAQGACIVAQANNYRPFGKGMDGESQYPENVADYGGVRLAYAALAKKLGPELHKADAQGMSPAKRFFYVYAQQSCAAQSPESLRKSIEVDHHAPPEFRVNSSLSNLPEFAEAFGCQAQDKMVLEASKQCVVW